MSSVLEQKKIVSLRTFADDQRQARETQTGTSSVTNVTEFSTAKQQKNDALLDESSLHGTTMRDADDTDNTDAVQNEMGNVRYNALSQETATVANFDQSSILSDADITYDTDSESGLGVIIQDRRHKRFKLFPAIFQSIASWFTVLQDDHKKHRERVPKVKKAESRLEIIEKAINGSEQAPKEDYESVAIHLKNTQRAPISTALNFKDKSEIPEPTWSSISNTELAEKETFSEASRLAQRELEDENKTTTSPTSVPTTPLVLIEQEQQREQVIDTALTALFDTKEELVLSPSKIPLPVLEKPLQEKEVSEVPIQRREPVQNIQSQTLPAPIEQPNQKIETKRHFAKPRTSSPPRIYFYMLIAVLCISSALGIGVTYYFFSLEKTSRAPVVQTVTPSPIQVQNSVPYILQSDPTMHILEIQKNIKTTQGVVRLIPEIHTSEGVRVATVSEILESLTLTAPPSFIRSIKEITFGGVNGSDAYIVLNVSSFDIGFAGMLAWEKTLQSDLSVLFNGTQLRGTSFTDTLTSNKNIRLLVDAQGNDVITYAFVNKNTIVITSTRTILDMLIPLVQ